MHRIRVALALVLLPLTLTVPAGAQHAQPVTASYLPVPDSTFVGALVWVKAAAEHQWYAGIVAAEQARAAAVSVGGGGGGGGGPHSDAWWQGVAQCEQGGRNDPYFGYFSFMDGSQGGRPWADQVAAGNAVLARAGREVGPWAASCVASGYRASPGG